MGLSVASKVDPSFIGLVKSLPEGIKKLEGIENTDPFILAEEYFKVSVADMSVDPNANITGKSPVNFHSEIFKPQLKLRSYYLLWEHLKSRYGLDEANKILNGIFSGLLYFHDITKLDVPYCFAPDTSFLMLEGRPYGWLPSSSPNKMQSFMGQLREMTMDFSQENAGAIGIANALVNLAYYTRERRQQLHKLAGDLPGDLPTTAYCALLCRSFSNDEKRFQKNMDFVQYTLFPKLPSCSKLELALAIVDYLLDKEIEDELQQTVHIFHNTFRIGGDSPFTNISLFDTPVLKKVFERNFYPDGSRVVDNIDEIMRVQKVYAIFFAKGSPITGKPYRFPVTTINIKTDENGKIIDHEFFDFMADLNREKCIFNWHIGEKIASCCRLTSDLSALKEQIRMDSFGNGGLSIGSHRVVTVNLHQVALLATSTNTSFNYVLNDALQSAERLLIVHKEDILKERVNSGILKFFNINWANLNMFFSTIGFTGLFDSYQVLAEQLGQEFDLDTYTKFAARVLDDMESYAQAAGKRNDGFAFNVEEIPGENASPKLAQKDNLLYGTDLALLSNQMVPLYSDTDLFTRLKVSSELMNKVSGGSILHLNVADQLTEGANRELLRRIIEDYKIPHFALNKGFSTCVNKHTTVGLVEKCPKCGADIDTYTTRVVGFFTDTKDWIKARREWEFGRRRWYGEEETKNA
jgi:anaerobic ribonucleoside-triphosphate reductase